jgi:hypothetical protein
MVTTKTTVTIKPGILVSLKSSVTGGVTYTRTTLDAPKLPESIAAEPADVAANRRDVERWETTKIVEDAAEHKCAEDARKKATGEIRKLCIKSAFGLICPLAYEAELTAAIERARATATGFNETARYTHVSLHVLRGHIASSDEEAVKAIGGEVRGLIAQMDSAIGKLDPEAIRDAASKAQSVAAMLGDEQSAVVSEAVKAARAAARTIAKRVTKDGEIAAVVLADIKRGAIEKARFAFLDLDDAAPVAPDSEQAPAANVQRVAGLDLDADGDEVPGEVEAASGAEPMTALIFPASEVQ